MRVLFLPHGPREWAGPRYRAWSLADAWPEAECTPWTWAPDISPYDAVVLGKVLDLHDSAKYRSVLQFAASVQAAGKILIWDFCDPIWWWNRPQHVRDLLQLCDAITVSSPGLGRDFELTFGRQATVIPDRMPCPGGPKRHRQTAKAILIWYGYSFNRNPCLLQSAILLTRLVYEGISFLLRIVDDRPDVRGWPLRHGIPEIQTERWDLHRFHEQLLDADIAFLPPYHGPLGCLKSNNKAVSAYWAGLPVHEGQDYYSLRKLIEHAELRAKIGGENRRIAERDYEIQTSVQEWKSLLRTVRDPQLSGCLASGISGSGPSPSV